MATPELISFIREQQRQKKSVEQITAVLRNAQWSDGDISDAFSQITPGAASVERLPSVKQLLSETFLLYKSRWKNLTGIVLIGLLMQLGLGTLGIVGLVIFGAAGILISGASSEPLVLACNAVFLIALLFIHSWSELALFSSITEQTGIWKSFHKTRFLIFPFLWLNILAVIAAFGGYVFFFIPGIIFSGWFLFSKYIFLTEHLRGLAPLYQSREYIRSRWSEMVRKFVVMPLVLGGIAAVLYVLGAFTNVFGGQKLLFAIAVGVLTFVFTFVIAPVVLAVYTFVMYQHAKRRPAAAGTTGKRTKWFIGGALAFGAVLAVLALAGIILAGVLVSKINPSALLKQAQQSTQEISILQGDLASYYNTNGHYPDTLIQAVPLSESAAVRQAVISGQVVYQPINNGVNYRLCFKNIPSSCVVTKHLIKVSPAHPASPSATIHP